MIRTAQDRSIKKNLDKYLMILPFGIMFLIFTVIPVVAAIVLSFTDFNMVQAPIWSGLDNYVRMFLDDDVFLIALRNTLIFAVITGPLSYLLCLILGWMVNEFGRRTRTFLTFIFYLPSISGSMVTIWSYILSGDPNGLLNSMLMRLGITDSAILFMSDTRFILPFLIVVSLWFSLGTSFLSFIAGFQGIDRSLYEAGAIDGIRTRFEELRKITLPSMGPQLMFAAVMQIGASFAAGGISVQLAGNPSTDYAGATIVTHLQDVGTMRYEMGYASAIAVLLFIAMIGTNTGIQKILKRYTDL